MNVITNDYSDLMDVDEGIYCDSMGDYRTWEMYFGPEYRPLILKPKEHCITIKFTNGVVANGSTNDIIITKVPVIIRSKQLLGKQIWLTIEYPEFAYDRIEPTSATRNGSVVTITGTNLSKISKVGGHPEMRAIGLLSEDVTRTNFFNFAVVSNFTEWAYSNTTNYNLTFREQVVGGGMSWCYQMPDDENLTWISTGDTNEFALTIQVATTNASFGAFRSLDVTLVNDGSLAAELDIRGKGIYTLVMTTDEKEYLTEYETKTLTLASPESDRAVESKTATKTEDKIVEQPVTETVEDKDTSESSEEKSPLHGVLKLFSF